MANTEYLKKTKQQLVAQIKKLQDEISVLTAGGQESSRKKKSQKESPNRYKDFFDYNPFPLWIYDKESMRFLEVNSAAILHYGYSREEFLSMTLKDIRPPEDIPLFLNFYNNKKEISGPDREYFILGLWRHLKKNGEIIYAETKRMDIRFGETSAGIVIVKDVTEQTKAQKSLRESEERFRLLADVAFEGIVFSENGKIIDANDRFVSMYGYDKREELIGKSLIEDFVVPEQQELVRKYIRLPRTDVYELKSKRKDDKIITVESRGQNIPYMGRNIRASVVYDISERKQYEIKIQQSEENYKKLIEQSPDGIFIHDEHGDVLFANPAALQIIGIETIQELNNKSIFHYVLPEYHNEIKGRKILLQQGEQQPFSEIKIKRPDGEIIEIEAKPISINYENKTATLVVYHNLSAQRQFEKEHIRLRIAEEANERLLFEINQKKAAEKKLEATQKYTRRLIDSSLDIIYAFDEKGIMNEFNDAAQSVFGYSADEILGKHICLLFANSAEWDNVEKKIFSGDGIFIGEISSVKKNGKRFIAYLSASILKDEKGQTIGAMGVSRDITEQRLAEEKVRLSEEKYRAIYNQAFVGIAQVGLFGEFLQVNQKLCDMLGYTKDELCSKTFMDVTYKEDVDPSLEYKERALRREINNFTTEKKYVHKNGYIIHADLTVSLVSDEKGASAYFVSVLQDRTEQKETEEKIKQSLKEKEVLLKEVHHRVKNNLQVISSILNLQSSFVEDKKILNLLKESQNRIKSMAFIHESLYQTKDFSSINFYEYVVHLSQNLAHSYGANESGIELMLNVEGSLLDLDKAIPCGLIINELVSNALKYAFPNNKKGKIYIESMIKNGTMSLVVYDNGIGLSPEIDFRNTPSLGLQLVVTLVEQIRGKISLERNKGTKYTILFES